MYDIILQNYSPASKNKLICTTVWYSFKPGDIYVNEIIMTSCQRSVFRISSPFCAGVLMAAIIGPNKRWLST